MSGLLFLAVIFTATIDPIFATAYTCDPNAACGCSPSLTVVTSRIVGGDAARNQTWNWMASFQYLGSHACGASLLTAEYAITAAHCIEEYKNNIGGVSIVVGTNYLNDNTSATIQRRSVMKMTTHSSYDPQLLLNDIGIIQFAPLNVSSTSKIRFVCLPKENQDPFEVNDSLVAVGWGATYDAYNAPVSNYLQQVTVQAYSSSLDDCRLSYMVDSTKQLCAGLPEGGKDTCQGDSGGPLMAFVNNRWILAAVTSFGDGCAQPGKPGIYTRVSSYIPFITSQIGLQTTTTAPIAVTTVLTTETTMAIEETTLPTKEISTTTAPFLEWTSITIPIGEMMTTAGDITDRTTTTSQNWNKTLIINNKGSAMEKSVGISLLYGLFVAFYLSSL